MSICKYTLVLLVLVLASCSSADFVTHTGNMPENSKIAQVKIGDTQDKVENILGTPSNVVSFNKNAWIYMSSDVKQVAFCKPEEVSRDVLTIYFDSNKKVSRLTRLAKKDGKTIEFDTDKTPTAGHDIGFFEKYFGGVGMFTPFGNAVGDSVQ